MRVKKYKWRIYADKNVERNVVQDLRRAGVDVLWVSEETSLSKQIDDSFHYQEARKRQRYLLTHDEDFWDDSKYPLHLSPGVIILSHTPEPDLGALLVRLLRKLLVDYNPLSEPLYLDGIKVKLSSEGITLRVLDHDTQQKAVDFWRWKDLY
jgi:predicted nuclease of predicted toxin-antitoxin system